MLVTAWLPRSSQRQLLWERLQVGFSGLFGHLELNQTDIQSLNMQLEYKQLSPIIFGICKMY